MTPRDYQHKNMMQIFLHFFKPHMGLFILDMVCALIVALVDLAYPLVSRCMSFCRKTRTGRSLP